jgi:hypothetical protein
MSALKKHGMPSRLVTKHLVPLMPKDEPSRVVAGFEALGWVDDFGQPTSDLTRLVQAYGDEIAWKAVLSEIVPKTYEFLPRDWEKMTAREMYDAFVTYAGRDAGAIKSAETFFLCLATDAGIRLSAEFDRRIGRQVTDAKRSIRLDRIEEEQRLPVIPQPGREPLLETRVEAGRRENQNANSRSLWGIWTEQILNLTAILDEHDMTDKERAAVLTLLSSLRRRESSTSRKTNA